MSDVMSLLAITFLAAAAEQTPEPPAEPARVLWEQISTLGLIEALTFISFGVVCLLDGWRIFKILVTICFGVLGLGVGIWANTYLIGGNVVWLATIAVIFFAVLSIPLMRWGVSLLGAVSGGILTAGAWLAFGLPEEYVWTGGLVGLIAGGMISFIVFKVAVILFTSLGGAVLTAVGVLAILYGYMVDRKELERVVFEYQWFLPALILAPMILGIALQYRLSKGTELGVSPDAGP